MADGDGRRGDSSERAPGREGADEWVHADRLGVVGEEVADGAEHIGGDEEAAARDPERGLMPAGEAHDGAFFDGRRERAADRNAVTRGDRVGVAAMPGHEDGDSGDGRGRERGVELGRVDGIDEQPALVEVDGRRRPPQELVRMGEPREAPVLVEGVRLQGAAW